LQDEVIQRRFETGKIVLARVGIVFLKTGRVLGHDVPQLQAGLGDSVMFGGSQHLFTRNDNASQLQREILRQFARGAQRTPRYCNN
jgi:hypothetical protein